MYSVPSFLGLGRTLDPRYPTNVAIGLLTPLVGILVGAATLLRGEGLLASVVQAIYLAGSFFLAWALAREVDPDHPYSAFAAAAISLVVVPFLSLPSLIAIYLLLYVARMISGTVGKPASAVEAVGMLIVAAWFSWQLSWVFGAAVIAAFLLDARLRPTYPTHIRYAAAAAALTLAIAVLRGSFLPQPPAARGDWLLMGLAGAAFILVIFDTRRIRVSTDAGSEPVPAGRVRASQLTTLLAAAGLAMWIGRSGLAVASPLWAVFLGVALYRLVDALFLRRKRQASEATVPSPETG